MADDPQQDNRSLSRRFRRSGRTAGVSPDTLDPAVPSVAGARTAAVSGDLVETGEDDGAGLAERFAQADVADTGLVVDAETDEQLEKDRALWLDLAGAGSKLVMAAATGDLPSMVDQASALVGALLDVQDTQARLLQSIDENVKLLVAEPFKDGCLQLEAARRAAGRSEPTPEHVAKAVKHVETAQERFFTARTLVSEPMDQVVVELHIAVTNLILNDPEETQHWLNEAYGKAWRKAHELAEQTGNTKVIKGHGIAQAATAYFTLGASAVYLAGKKVKRSYSSKHAQEALRGVLPLVRCIAMLHVASGGGSGDYPVLELHRVKRASYELVAVAL